eukprot:gene843-1115_t
MTPKPLLPGFNVFTLNFTITENVSTSVTVMVRVGLTFSLHDKVVELHQLSGVIVSRQIMFDGTADMPIELSTLTYFLRSFPDLQSIVCGGPFAMQKFELEQSHDGKNVSFDRALHLDGKIQCLTITDAMLLEFIEAMGSAVRIYFHNYPLTDELLRAMIR